MSRQPDAESYSSSRSRQRANTASFPSFGWMKPRQEPQDAPPPPPPPNIDALIQSLSPPAVPSIKNARALASAIGTQSPLPRRPTLNPVLASLCDVRQPSSLQSVGFEILSAYFEHHEASALTTSDRLSYFSLFLGPAIPWALELWETRYKALRAMTRWGADIVGIETPFLGVLRSWIDGSFEGLLRMDSAMDRTERSERERSIDLMANFLTSVVEIPETIARISEEELAGVLQFYAQLVDRSVVLPIDLHCQERLVSNFLDLKTQQQQRNWYLSTPPKTSPPAQTHRRNQSSLSIPSSPSPSLSASASSSVSAKFFSKHPAEIVIPLYLNHLSAQLKISSPTQLNAILPVLFRALAFCSSPLPRLSLLHQTAKKSTVEETITETLNSLFLGPYSSSCMLILKEYLSPHPVNPDEFVIPSDSTKPLSSVPTPTSTFYLPSPLPKSLKLVFLTARGAHRTFRNHVRRALFTRLARAYITRETSMAYSPSGAPGHMEVERDLMERAWPRDDFVAASGFGTGPSGWDAARLGKVLAESAEAWVLWHSGWDPNTTPSPVQGNGNGIFRMGNGDERWVLDKEREEKEFLLDEIANVLLDLLQELEAREEDHPGLDEEEAAVISDTLNRLATYVLPLRNGDGTPFLLPLDRSISAPTPFLRTLASLLGTDYQVYIGNLLPPVLLEVVDNLSDLHTARICQKMAEQQDLSPTSPDWLDRWNSLLMNSTFLSLQRPLTRAAVFETLDSVYESVRDMRMYRRPLADVIWEFCNGWVSDHEVGSLEDGDAVWRVLGEEVVLRAVEYDGVEVVDIDAEGEGQGDGMSIGKYIALLVMVSEELGVEESLEDDGDTISILTVDTQSPSPNLAFGGPSAITTPILSRMQSDFQPKEKEKESALPSVMSILSSLTAANASRTRLDQTPTFGPTPERSMSPTPAEPPCLPRCVAAASALIGVFSQLALTPFVLQPSNLRLAIKIFETLVNILLEGKSSRVRVTILQFLLRLRADRDHRVYYTESGFDAEGHSTMLASLIGRFNENGSHAALQRPEEPLGDGASELRKTRPKMPQERDGRPKSRGRGTGVPTASRSRSRVTAKAAPPSRVLKPRGPLWQIPEVLPFAVPAIDSPSEALRTYDHPVTQTDSERIPIPLIPISLYLTTLIQLVEKEKNWEIVSYILCHLPNQLANKHFFCGPKTTGVISVLLSSFCSSLLSGTFSAKIERMHPLKARDAQGLAYHTLSVLVGHRRCFDMQQRHLLIEGLQAGLNGQDSTIKCCLHALSIAAFELQPSLIRYLPRVMEKLSQIMSNPNMSVHILDFISIVGSLPPLYANFTEADYKVVFGLALQYLQHYNRLDSSPTVSWALSQHVRILSYYAVYVWFLAVRLPDRPHHVRFITRQLLLANEGSDQVDGPTEVCFDWLARYTYASADPRPARSLLSDIVMSPSSTGDASKEPALSEKTWIAGNAVTTLRTLPRLGWVEVETRRPSGFSRFLCHAENVPMIGLGDVHPDQLSVPLALLMGRDPPRVESQRNSEEAGNSVHSQVEFQQIFANDKSAGEDAPRPDSVTGYVWSGSAPSQRRKGVAIDPSYLLLQLSSYPDLGNRSSIRMVPSTSNLSKFFVTLDRVPVIDTHKVGIMYVAPGQTNETEILRNTHGSPAYTHFLEGIGRLINLRGQLDVYAGGLDPDEDGEYAYAWWDDIGQVLYHTATMMPTTAEDPNANNKKRHIGNDYVRIVWNDSGKPYKFDTLATQFQFVNIVIEPHSRGAIAAFSNNLHEHEYFKVTVQRAPGMTEFTPIGHFKLISAENLPLLVRQISLLADWFASVFSQTQHDTVKVEVKTNWLTRLEAIRRFRNQLPTVEATDASDGLMGQEASRDFTTVY